MYEKFSLIYSNDAIKIEDKVPLTIVMRKKE
jgi:hypothetical protein